MLSFAVCARASPSTAPRPLLLSITSSASTAKHIAYSKATTTRTGPSLVLCRFRHTKTIDNPRPSSGYKSGDFRPTYSKYERRGDGGSYPRGSFGGEEFAPPWETTALRNAVDRFRTPNSMQVHLESLGTPRDEAVKLIKEYSAKALRGSVPQVSKKAIVTLADQSLEVGMTFKGMGVTKEEAISSKLDKALWDGFFEHSQDKLPAEALFRMTRLREIADLRYPSEWSPAARLMKRKIVMHVGPTNSGKTHNALVRLQSAESGAYLSPLRLLAHEIYERMNAAGKPCNLVTGEERRYGGVVVNGEETEKVMMTSCTIEMADMSRQIEVAVIDEIQMLADPQRGWAWTQALLSLPAKELHLCGEPTVVDLVKNICALTNEEVEIHRYDRLSKLEVQEESLKGRLDKIQKGDCVVTFSRRNIFLLKKAIEAETGLRCAVAYGALPPESRSMQAKLFNDPTSGYDVLVASDAIGMGLNLNIRRIIFEAVEKFDGNVVRNLSLTQLKQIAGRAGRFGTDYALGQATTLLQADIPAVKRALAAPMIDIQRAAIQPTPDMFQEFSIHLPGAPFSHILRMFEMMARNSNLFFAADYGPMIDAAVLIDKIKIPTQERLMFISAPIQVRNPVVVKAAVKLAEAISTDTPIKIDDLVRLPKLPAPSTDDSNALKPARDLDLQELESAHRVIMLYLWLAQKFEMVMTGGIDSVASQRKVECEVLIELGLKQAQSARLRREQEKQERKAQKAELLKQKKEGSVSAKATTEEKA